jgi:N-dimethylarginine dimethylaminohydrolase
VIYLHDVVESPKLTEIDYQKEQYKTNGQFSYEHLSGWMNEWKGYWQNVAFDFNVLVVDSKNIFISNQQPRLQELLDKRGITCHIAPIRHNIFWEAGIHCLTLDVKRRGEKRTIL